MQDGATSISSDRSRIGGRGFIVRLRLAWLLALSRVLAASVANAAEAPDFAREVRPLLDAHCVKCHGPEKQKGGVRFDLKDGALKPAESGNQAIVPGNAGASRLITLVSSKDEAERMPPKGDRLSAAQIDLLTRWINGGAAWTDVGTAPPAAPSEMQVTGEDRKHWSFLPLRSPLPPSIGATRAAITPIDRFILARLEAQQLALSPEAEPARLVRRLYFDTIGLPPTPEQVDAFITAYGREARSAVAELVDRLLASPHYGERWARHWLDVARYADSDGQESDSDRVTAYHFRDFVVCGFNDDMPFDAFLRWQLAGDELEPDNPRAIAATGFIVAGTHAALPANLMEEERMRERFNELDDMIATTGSAMLGLTLACARCHDHKYDPVPRRDYYRIQCAFNGGDRAQVPLVPLVEARRQRELEANWKAAFDPAKRQLEDWLKQLRAAYEPPARTAKIDALPVADEEKTLLRDNPDSPSAKELAKKFAKELKLENQDLRALATDPERAEWDAREAALAAASAQKPPPLPASYAFADFGPQPRQTFLLARGDFRARTEPLELGFLTALTHDRTPADYWAAARANSRRDDSTQQRRALAMWMTDTAQGAGALAARVIVNRMWQHHFGDGLVRTVNDFGARATPPTHPELLEWLTFEFVRSGWRMKPIQRLILNSAVYLQGAAENPTAAQADPENRLYWRRRPRRLEAEALRDAMLATSGALNRQMLGPAVKGPIDPEAIQARNMKDPYPKDIADAPTTHRRSIYMFHKRVVQSPLMQAFDGPDAQASCGRREITTVAPQALALLNDRVVRARAADFARRVGAEAGSEAQAQVRRAWRIALSRDPSRAEVDASVAFLQTRASDRAARDSAEDGARARALALTDFCQAIFALNEFIYVD
jgi:mono/diheme cytochrome c family protein